jgi:glucose-1-phosphate thymidylyltransferase
MRGLILAAGTGSRLSPSTMAVSKHLIPIFDKPMVYYPLSTLMLAGIKEIGLVVNEVDLEGYRSVLGSGDRFGISISYFIQSAPAGLADAVWSAREFLENQSVAVVLGDNLIFGGGVGESLGRLRELREGAFCFAKTVSDPRRFGVVELVDGRVESLSEKPQEPKSNLALVGLYFFDHTLLSKIATLSQSARGELEITDCLTLYLAENALNCEVLGRGVTWLDAGTVESLFEAAEFVKIQQSRTGLLLGSPEEVALHLGFISQEAFLAQAKAGPDSYYFKMLRKVGQGD